jgi:hypothetical protein
MRMSESVFAALGHTGRAAGSAAWVSYVAATMVVLAAVFATCWFAVRWADGSASGGEDSHDDGDGGGGGGRGGGRGPSPPPRSPAPDPAWWPQFEREFNAYIEATSRTLV